MPRNRIARAAVLAGSVQRSAASSSSRNRSVVRRRVVLGILVIAALVLITLSVREDDSGQVHKAQNVGTTVLQPFQVGAERVARRVLARGSRLAPHARPAIVNGNAGVIVGRGGRPIAVVAFAVERGRIVEIDLIANPAKLARVEFHVE